MTEDLEVQETRGKTTLYAGRQCRGRKRSSTDWPGRRGDEIDSWTKWGRRPRSGRRDQDRKWGRGDRWSL